MDTSTVQNICSVKTKKLANMWEEMEVFVKIREGSIPQFIIKFPIEL